MKYLFLISLTVFLAISCNEQKEKNTTTVSKEPLPNNAADSFPATSIPEDSIVINTTRQVLLALRARDFNQVAAFIHPREGVRFSPYGYVDTLVHKSFLPIQFRKFVENRQNIFWGYFDGSGDSITLNVQEYFNRFVYNADFLNAKETSINKMIGSGNSLNNLQTIYKNIHFTESYFPGFDAKYGGMDWCSLRLVYKKFQDKYYLVAVIHDQWTT